MPRDAILLDVETSRQLMVVRLPDRVECAYPVSTSRFGLGEEECSLQTPAGLHEVVERFGDEAPAGAVFESRVWTGEVWPPARWQEADGDKILSRILRLSGREPGRNAGGHRDTYARMIYLHGTNQEHFVGVRPSSHGCIRMKNADVIALYERVRGGPVWVVIR